jgi:hypothetical protein
MCPTGDAALVTVLTLSAQVRTIPVEVPRWSATSHEREGELPAGPVAEKARSAAASKVVAVALLAVGALGWLVLAATTNEPWSEALIEAGVWSAVAVLAWFWPLVGAILLVVGAALGFFLALLVTLVEGLMALGQKHSDAGRWFWLYVGWWSLLPAVSAFLFLEARERAMAERATRRQGLEA